MTVTQLQPRIGWVDAGRGLAVLGMVVFHAAWDLHYFGLSDVDPSATPGWRLFGHAVACGFLFLSGLGLVLARRRCGSQSSAMRRLAWLAATASSVTAVTWVVMPDGVILFGILHCIAVGNALALLVLDAPVLVLLGLAGLAILLPDIATGSLPPTLWWVGLSTEVPISLDSRPILPWIAPILVGVAAGRSTHLQSLSAKSGRLPSKALGIAGRHSLAIYLLHQPALIALLMIVTGNLSRPPASIRIDAPAFVWQCEAECTAAGTDAAYCRSACNCAVRAALRSPSGEAAGLALSCSEGTAIPVPRSAEPTRPK